MQFRLFLLCLTLTTVESFKIGGASSAVNAAKRFLAGKKKTQAVQTNIAQQQATYAIGQSSDDGIMKKSVDFLTHGSLLIGGLGSIYDHFSDSSTPVSFLT